MALSEKSLEFLIPLKLIGDEISSNEQEEVTNIFQKILFSGNSYKIEEIEDWLKSNTKMTQNSIDKILNTAHYQKAKYDARNPLKMAPDSCGCGGDC